jgi:hypothetical protein
VLTEEQLIIEGRKDDTKKKYPELAQQRKELDGESLLDVLIQADPSDNQKYLMGSAKILQKSIEQAEQTGVPFWGKKWPEDADDNLYSPWGIAKNIASELLKFHKLQPFLQTARRDINIIKDYGELRNVVEMGVIKQQNKEKEKEAKAQEKRTASEESTIVADNDYYTMIRPTTAHASCYYGKGTKWCISATQSGNYFDEYTSEGKSFYFVFFTNISNINPFKKLALVVGMDGTYEEAFNAEDESLTPAEVVDAIIQNMLNEKQDTGALEVYRFMDGERHTDEPLEKDREDYVRMVKELGIAWDDELATSAHLFEEEAKRANEAIRNKAELWFRDMKQEAETAHQEDPPGPSEEAYNEILANYEPNLNHIGVSIEMPYDTGASQPYWSTYLSVDIESYVMDNKQRLKWKKSAEQIAEEGDELKEAVDNALNTVDIWPDTLEQDYGDLFSFNISLDPGSGTPDDFEGYMDNIQYLDNAFTEGFAEALLNELVEKDLIGRDPKEEHYWPDPEEKKKQIELPFEKGTEEGAQTERDLDYIRSPAGSALRRRVGLRENKGIRIKIKRKKQTND